MRASVSGSGVLVAFDVADELDVAAERDRRQLPARAVAIVEADEFRAEADREGRHPDAAPAADEKVAHLVDEHHDRQHRTGRARDSRRASPSLPLPIELRIPSSLSRTAFSLSVSSRCIMLDFQVVRSAFRRRSTHVTPREGGARRAPAQLRASRSMPRASSTRSRRPCPVRKPRRCAPPPARSRRSRWRPP